MISAGFLMAMIAASALFLSGYSLVRRRLGLRPDESLLLAGLLACLEVTATMQILGLASCLRPLPVRLATAALVGLHLAAAYGRPAVRPVGGRRQFPRWLVPAALVVSATLAVRLVLAWTAPPDGWDALGYHLPFVVRWMQQGSLDLSGWAGTHRYFAWNGDLLSAWLALLDGGALAAAKMPQILGLPLLLASGSVLGRRLAGPRAPEAT